MSWSSTSYECKECSPENLNKERMKSNLKTLRHTRKRPLHADRRRQLGGEPTVHSRSMVKIFYNKDIVSRWLLSRSDLMMIEEVPHGYVPMFQTMIYIIDQSYMKTSEKNQCSRLKYIWNQASHYLWWSPERRKWFSNTYLHRWEDKQTFW